MTRCLLCGGPDRHIRVGGADFRFEDHPRCGPMLLTATGEIASNQRPRSPFWVAVTRWYAGGKQVGADGYCTWEPEPETKIVHLGGRHYAVVPPEGFRPDGVLARWAGCAAGETSL
jgi:hypothetical protein